jgi:hypothetical protein
MRAILFSVPLVFSPAFGCNGPEPPPLAPKASVKDLMVSIVDPAADALWGSVGSVISEEGVDEWYPRTDEEWAAVRGNAVTIMESGNLLMIGDRARDQGAGMEMSRALVDAGAEALAAAESKSPDAVFAVGERIYLTCERCHELYRIDASPIRDAEGRRD